MARDAVDMAERGLGRFGMAPRYLRIAGTWQDHAMYQVLDPAAED